MILEELGIFGFSKVKEQAIFASILLGDPILFIGPPGTAKTEVIAAIGSALRESSKRINPTDTDKWFNYQIYDASKLNFEDLVGYPNISKMKAENPVVEYIPTKSTIWNKHMIAFDEINRCTEDRQSNLFEIIRSRKLHGIETNNLFIAATMNPFGDVGTVESSDALLDRFLFYLNVEDFGKMDEDNRCKVITRRGPVDSVGITYWAKSESEFATHDDSVNHKLADVGDKIKMLMFDSSKYLQEYQKALSSSVSSLVSKIVQVFYSEFNESNHLLCISGRRAAMMMRGALALRAVQAAMSDDVDLGETASSLINSFRMCIPVGISGKVDHTLVDRANALVSTTVGSVWPTLFKQTDNVNIDSVITASRTKDPLIMLNTLLDSNINEFTRDKIIGKLLDKETYKNNNNLFNTQLFLYVRAMIFFLSKEIPNFLPSHITVDISQKELEEAQEVSKLPTTTESLKKYHRLISNYITTLDNDLLKFVARLSFSHIIHNSETDEIVLHHLNNMMNLAKKVEEELKMYKKPDETTNTCSA